MKRKNCHTFALVGHDRPYTNIPIIVAVFIFRRRKKKQQMLLFWITLWEIFVRLSIRGYFFFFFGLYFEKDNKIALDYCFFPSSLPFCPRTSPLTFHNWFKLPTERSPCIVMDMTKNKFDVRFKLSKKFNYFSNEIFLCWEWYDIYC